MSKHTTCALAREMYVVRQILTSLPGNEIKTRTKRFFSYKLGISPALTLRLAKMRKINIPIYLPGKAIFLNGWEDKRPRILCLGRWTALVQILAPQLILSTSYYVGKILNISEPQFPHLENGNDYIFLLECFKD